MAKVKYAEFNIAGTVFLAGSAAFVKGPTQNVTLSDGSTKKQYLRNQITVLQLECEPLDLDAEKQAGYYYGSASLTSLRLVCDYFFFKNGYEDKKPAVVKKIGQEEEEKDRGRSRGRGGRSR